jgi:glycosyltransferase involved in cell wall biosynthesis
MRAPVDCEILRDYLRPYYLKWFYFRVYPERRANYLVECWSKPHFPVTEKIQDIIPRRTDRPDVLFLPMTDWHARIQRSQHLAMNFGSLGARCFYLNPHLGREFPNPYRRRHDIRAGLVAPRVLEFHAHLPREPFYHRRMLTASETDRLFSGVDRLIKAAGTRKMIQFVSFPLWSEVTVRLKREFGFPIVYDCHDLLSGFRDIGSDIIAAEAEVFEGADLVCFSSQWLLNETVRERPSAREKSIVVRNGVNPADYSHLAPRERTGKPVIGYAGSLDFWFDVDAIRQAAERHPEWTFILIGRVESEPIHQLASLPNVSLVGEVVYSELPSRTSDFDVAVIPFLKMPLTLATNPLKLYEYFCLGVPVVSTRLPEIEPFSDLVNLYDDPGDFVRQLELAVAQDDARLRARRRAAAESNGWRARCEQLNRRFDLL